MLTLSHILHLPARLSITMISLFQGIILRYPRTHTRSILISLVTNLPMTTRSHLLLPHILSISPILLLRGNPAIPLNLHPVQAMTLTPVIPFHPLLPMIRTQSPLQTNISHHALPLMITNHLLLSIPELPFTRCRYLLTSTTTRRSPFMEGLSLPHTLPTSTNLHPLMITMVASTRRHLPNSTNYLL